MKILKAISFVLMLFWFPNAVGVVFAQDQERPKKNVDLSLKTFRSETFKFQIKYPKHCRVVEFPGEHSDSYITKFWIPCDHGETSIHVSKKDPDLTSSETLRAKVIKWMAWDTWPQEQMMEFTKQITEITIGTRPAVRWDYLYGAEPPGTPSPAVNVWTFNESYSYRIGCCCGKKECDDSITTFSFTE